MAPRRSHTCATARALAWVTASGAAWIVSVAGCQGRSSSLDVDVNPAIDYASARECPDGHSLKTTVTRDWQQAALLPLAALHTSSPTAGTWWIENVSLTGTTLPDSTRLVFAQDGDDLPSITVDTLVWNLWHSFATIWKIYQEPGSPLVWTLLSKSSYSNEFRVCRTDPTLEEPETRCGDFSQNPAGTGGASTWQRELTVLEGTPYLTATKRIVVPYDEGFYCSGALAGTGDGKNDPLVEIPFCFYRIVDGSADGTLDLTDPREGEIWFGDDSDRLSLLDTGDPISVEASMATGADGKTALLADLGAGYGASFPHLTRWVVDGNGELQRGNVTTGAANLPVPSELTVPWNLQLGQTPSQFVVAQTYEDTGGGYQLKLYFADSVNLVWKSFAVERQIPADPSEIPPLLLQLDDFPITVSVIDGQLQRVDGSVLEPLAAASGAASIEQAGRSHVLVRYSDDTASLLKVTCDL